MQLLNVVVNYSLITFVFFATLTSYNFHYILAGALGKKTVSYSLFTNRPSAAFFLLLGFTGAVISYFNTHITFGNVILSVLLTSIYSVPLLPWKELGFTRKAGIIKTLLLAFTWMFVTAYLPMAEHEMQYSALGKLILIKRFLFMLMLCILFDNRDVKVDQVNGLHSLATDLSPTMMRWLIFIVFMLLFSLNFFFGKHGISNSQVLALQLSSLATLAVYFYSLKKPGYFFYYFIVDGMMILMTVLTTIASI